MSVDAAAAEAHSRPTFSQPHTNRADALAYRLG
jgi:hypothetical protein